MEICVVEVTHKTCARCKVEKLAATFYRDKRTKRDGLMGSCKECHNSRVVNWQNSNRDKVRAAVLARHRNNVDGDRVALKAWRAANPERTKQQWVRSRARNGTAIYARNAARTEQQRRATPAWANKFFIEEAYELARLRTKVTGFKWHVDHVIPLKGKNVCGLHVETNFAVIPAAVNVRKQASFLAA